jgi:hypothetical protein
MDQHRTTSTSTPGATHMTRRTLIGASAAAGFVAAASSSASAATGGASAATQWLPEELVRRFAQPGTETAAGFRWWWPHGLVDPVEIAREVDQVADAGFGVLEVADVTHSLRARNISIDVASHGWGTTPWVAGVKAALARAAERGVRIDITVGPSWPAAVPTITPDDEAACTELAHGRADLAAGATYDGPVPEAVLHAEGAVTRQTLVALQAHRYTPSSNTRVLPQVDPASYVDLLDQVVDGRITWTAPASPEGGYWVLLSFWQRGSAQEPEAGPHTDPRSYVVDHFSALGSQAVVDLWEDTVLDRELRGLLGKAGGYLFEDSLEIETEATIWTPRMFEEFEKRAGYDLRPWLPVVMELKEKYLFDLGTGPGAATTDGLRTNQVRDDYNQVLSDLYRDHHLLPLQAFARTLGMGLRVQPYGLETDTVEHAALLDVPETESLGFKNLDDYRVMAGGRDMAGHTILSCEAICYNGAAYNTMLGGNGASPTQQNQALFTLNSIFAAGVNQAIIHGFPHADAPGVTWPGFAAFSPYYNGAIGFGEAWGPRTPQWQHMPDIAAYLARTQLVLQTGTPKYDVVFLRQKGWTSTGIGAFWATNDGIPLGWTHSFATPALLDLPRAKVKGGRLAPDGPAYKAMIIGTDQFRGQVATMAVATARRVLELGRAGLPIVFVRDWSDPRPVGLPEGGETQELRDLVAQIKALPTTRLAAADADIPGALAALGVTPDVQHERSTVMTVRRVLGDVDLYYVANARHAENRRLARVTQDVWLTASSARAVPVQLDAWTGEARPVGLWERHGDRVRVRVDLAPGQSTVIALTAPQSDEAADLHAVATTAVDVLKQPGRLLVRAGTAGEHTATLGDGRTVRATISRVRAPIELATWRLEVEDWQPGATATETIKPVRTVQLTTLAPWSQVPGLEDVSGVGRYTTEVDLGADWTDRDGAWLELGEVTDTFRVRVNGVAVAACDPLHPRVDLAGLLRSGSNVIEVEVASTLLNRLRTVTPSVYGVAQRQAYGLLGPVRLVPYVDEPVRR